MPDLRAVSISLKTLRNEEQQQELYMLSLLSVDFNLETKIKETKQVSTFMRPLKGKYLPPSLKGELQKRGIHVDIV